MIALTQHGNRFNYLSWIPSESGPLISNFGTVKSPQNFLFKNGDFSIILQNVLGNVDGIKPRFQFSLDAQQIFFSQSFINDSEYLSWEQDTQLEKSFFNNYDTHNYPFNNCQLLNIHIPTSLKNNIIDAIRDINGEIRGINIGIFSAEIGARQWYHANQLESYVIWNFGKNHTDEALIIQGNELKAYFKFKRLKQQAKLIYLFGDSILTQKFIESVELWLSSDIDEINSFEKVFVYSNDDKNKDIKSIIGAEIHNVKLLNPFDILETTEIEKVNPFRGASFAETGAGFRGIDV